MNNFKEREELRDIEEALHDSMWIVNVLVCQLSFHISRVDIIKVPVLSCVTYKPIIFSLHIVMSNIIKFLLN